MKKILIVGASILQLPAVRKAKEMGLEVAVADFNPHAIAIPYADHYFNCSTIDPEGMLAVARSYAPDGIMTMATDMPMRTIAYVCKMCGLPGISEECAFLCTDKIAMVQRFRDCGVPCPQFATIRSQEELEQKAKTFAYPCILKPSDSSGSRGVCLVNSMDEALERYAYVKAPSRDGQVLMEEYMRGPEVSVETFVVDGKAHVLQITDKRTTGAPHFVETGHSQPSKLPADVQTQIREVAQKACASVGLINGPAHLEMIVTQQGPKMVEMGARLGGDCITSHLVPLSTGISMVEQLIRQSMGLPVNLTPTLHCGSAIRFLSASRPGVLQKICHADLSEHSDTIREIGWFKQIGDTVDDVHSSSDRLGYVIAQAESADAAMDSCCRACEKIKITIK